MTSEFRKDVWGTRPPKAPINSELVPEPMSAVEEELESPPPTPQASSPAPPMSPPVPQTFEEKDTPRTRSSTFPYFKCCLVVLGFGLSAMSIILYINWPSVHSALSGRLSHFRSSREYTPASKYSEPTSRIEFSAAYGAQSAPNRYTKPNFISLVSLQTKFEKVTDDLDGNSFASNLKYAENEMKDLSQRAKHSTLPNRDPLVEQLSLITSTAKDTGRNFQRFSSRAGGTLDQIVAANRCILREVENLGGEPVRNLDANPNRLAPAFLKPGVSGLLQEANSTAYDLDALQVELNFASGMAAQLKADYTRQKTQNKPLARLVYLWVDQKALKDFDSNRELLDDICAELERASARVKGELSLLHRISNDLHVIHDQLSAATVETHGI